MVAMGLLLGLASCDLGPTELRMHVLNQHQVNGEALREIFSARGSLRLVAAEAERHESSLEVLLGNRADIALVNNSTAFTL